jgi:hypothetical protein
MKLKEIIKSKLATSGFDRNELLIESIEKLITPALEDRAAKLVTPRIIKRAVGALLKA